jgi:hypothetical protein
MSAFADRAADASLLVAGPLLFGAAVCWITTWAQGPDDRWTSAARAYLAPLADVGLVAIVVHAFALVLAGDASFASWATTAVVACVALALREPPRARTDTTEEPPPEREPEPAPTTVSPPPRRSLWADPLE